MADKNKQIAALAKIANDLSKIVHKRDWFTKQERKELDKALEIMNKILAERIKQSQSVET